MNIEDTLRQARGALVRAAESTTSGVVHSDCMESIEQIDSTLARLGLDGGGLEAHLSKAWHAMIQAHSLCPVDLSHPSRMRWITGQFLSKA